MLDDDRTDKYESSASKQPWTPPVLQALRIESPERSRPGSRSPIRARSPQESSNGAVEDDVGPSMARMMSAPTNAPAIRISLNGSMSHRFHDIAECQMPENASSVGSYSYVTPSPDQDGHLRL